MITLTQWRVSIGLWHCHIPPSPTKFIFTKRFRAGVLPKTCVIQSNSSHNTKTHDGALKEQLPNAIELQKTCSLVIKMSNKEARESRNDHNNLIKLYCVSVLVVFMILLILSGDIESNPGPKTGDTSSSDLFRAQTASLANCIAPVLYTVTNEFYAKGLIPLTTKNEILVAGVLTDYFKASKLVNVLETQLEVSNDPDKYLINICHVLINQHHQPLTDIGNTILQQLGQQPITIPFISAVSSVEISSDHPSSRYTHVPSLNISDRNAVKSLSQANEIAYRITPSPSSNYQRTLPPISDPPPIIEKKITLAQAVVHSSVKARTIYLSEQQGEQLFQTVDVEDIQEKIAEFKEMILDNLEMMKQAMKKSKNKVGDIIEYIHLHIAALLSPKLDKPSIKEFLRKEFSRVTTFADLFIVLEKYTSWFNYEFTAKLVRVFLSHDAELKKAWASYSEHLKDFFTNYNGEALKFSDAVQFGLSNIPGTQILVAKVARDDYTINDIFFFHKAIPKALGLSRHNLYFCSIDAGCIELKYSIDDWLYSEVFPLTNQQIQSLANIGIIKLTCGDFIYPIQEIVSPIPVFSLPVSSVLNLSIPNYQPSLSLDVYDPLWYENTSSPLHEACWQGLTSEVKWLFEKFENKAFSSKNLNWWSPLHSVAYGGNLELMQLLVDYNDFDPSVVDGDNVTCLHMACYKGHVDVVLYLLDTCNINADTCDNSFNTPFLYAAMGGHWDIVSLLLDRNCATDQCNREGATLSLLACKSGNIALIHKLEALNVFSYDETDYSDRTVLHYSCMSDNVELLKHLTTHYQLSIDVKDRYGITPLHIAAKYVSSSIIEHIISIRGKESLLEFDNNGMSSIHHLCCAYDEVCGSNAFCKISSPKDVCIMKQVKIYYHKNMYILNAFLKTNINSILHEKRLRLISYFLKIVSITPGFSINSTTYDGKSLLHLSCYSGNMLLVKLLEQYNISTTSLDYGGSSAVHYAALSGSPSLLHYIITQYSLNITDQNYNGELPLSFACQAGRLNAIKIVIDSTSNINSIDSNGMTFLHHSCFSGHADVSQYLIDTHKSDVNTVNSTGCNVLDCSVWGGNHWLVQYFIHEHKFQPKNDSLKHAVLSTKLPLVKELIDAYYLDPHQRDSKNVMLIHYAAMNGDITVLDYLMKCCQCDITVIDNDGWNIFHFSAYYGHIHFIKHVIEHYRQCINLIHSQTVTGVIPLHSACASGNTKLVKLLINDLNCDVTAKDDEKTTCVHFACTSGNLGLVKLLIQQYKVSPLVTDNYGQTSLHISAQKGQFHILEWICHEYNINVSTHGDIRGLTLLHLAAVGGHLHCLQHLINKYWCDINAIAYGFNSYTPLHDACENRQFVVVSYLTSLPQCNVTAKTSNQSTVLHLTCKTGSFLILKHLVDNHSHELDLCAFNDDGVAPIHLACQNGTLTIVQYILEHSPKSLDLPDINGYTPLLTAAYYNHLQVIKYLNSQRCNISVLDGKGFNVLHVSAENGCLDIIKYLIEGDYCDPNITDNHNRSSLHIALINDQLAIVDYLMDSPNYMEPRVQFDLQDNDGNSPLHISCDVGQPDMVSILCRAYLSHNKNVLQTNNKGWTPLHCAAAKGHINSATVLLEATTGTPFHNGLLQSTDKQGQTVFHIACINGQYRMFLYLSSVYPDGIINIRDDRGRGLLHGACQSSSLELVQYLVETQKLDTESSDRDGVACLHLIACQGDIEMYRYLVSRIPHQFNLIPVNKKGRTPLHYSCLSGQYGMSVFLIKTFRVHPEDKDNKGFTPLHAACKSGNVELVLHFLKDMKCKSSVETKSSKSLVYFASKSSNLRLVRLLVETYKLKVQPQDIEVAKSVNANLIVQYFEIYATLDIVATQFEEKKLIRLPLAT